MLRKLLDKRTIDDPWGLGWRVHIRRPTAAWDQADQERLLENKVGEALAGSELRRELKLGEVEIEVDTRELLKLGGREWAEKEARAMAEHIVEGWEGEILGMEYSQANAVALLTSRDHHIPRPELPDGLTDEERKRTLKGLPPWGYLGDAVRQWLRSSVEDLSTFYEDVSRGAEGNSARSSAGA